MTGALHSRLFQASAATALAVIILGLGYLSQRGQPLTRKSPVEKLRIALPVLPHRALVHVAAAMGYFAAEGLGVSILPVSCGVAAIGIVAAMVWWTYSEAKESEHGSDEQDHPAG